MNDNFDAARANGILAECVTSVFADMAFIDVKESGADCPAPERQKDESVRRAAIDVLTPLSCRIELNINTALRDRIIETLFGDLAVSEQKKTAEDTLLEMLNITAGSFLSSYFGTGTDIQLELPRYLYQDELYQGQTISAISMDAEGEPLEIILSSVRYRY